MIVEDRREEPPGYWSDVSRDDVYLTRVVGFIVCDLDFFKCDHLFSQLLRSEGGVRVTVESVRRSGVCLAGHQPGGAVVGVPVPLVVTGHDVQQDEVLAPGLQVDVGEAAADGGEHPPARPGDDHLSPELTELVPEILVVQNTFDLVQI